MVKSVPNAVSLPFEPTLADVRQLCFDAKIRVPSPEMCGELAEALGHIGRMLAQRIHAMGKSKSLVASQHEAFWQAMDLLDFALPGLHPLYGPSRTYVPGHTSAIDAHTAFENIMGAMQVASRFVPRDMSPPRPLFDEGATILGLLKLYEHAFVPKPDRPVSLSSDGPATRFISKALQLVSSVQKTPGAIYQRLIEKPSTST